jgi:hypothetical protein
MIVELQMAYISMTNFTSKNRSEPVFFRSINRKRPVLGGPVQSPQYLGRSWTGCGCGCPIWRSKNRTGPDFRTLSAMDLVLLNPPEDAHKLSQVATNTENLTTAV